MIFCGSFEIRISLPNDILDECSVEKPTSFSFWKWEWDSGFGVSSREENRRFWGLLEQTKRKTVLGRSLGTCRRSIWSQFKSSKLDNLMNSCCFPRLDNIY